MRYALGCVKQFNRGVFAKDARRCDVMFISSTPPIQGAMAALIKKIRGIPMVYNLQDIFPDSLVGTGLAKQGSFLWKVGRVVENFTYRNSDKIIVISEDFKKNIMAKGVPEHKIEVIYNWVDEKAVVPIAKSDNILYEELGLSRDNFHVVYAGNFGNAQNIDVIIRAAQRLQDYPDVVFTLFGTGGLKDDFEKMVQELNLKNVRFFPLQPYDKVSYVYSLGDVGIVSCKKGIGKGAMPSKTWSILSAGTPVVANYDKDTDIETILESNKIGLFSDADDVDGFVEAILTLYRDRNLCAEMGRRGREYVVGNLTKEIGTSKIVRIIEQFEKKE
jgi:glycosyltransferase involved in cell wall biosynthesis